MMMNNGFIATLFSALVISSLVMALAVDWLLIEKDDGPTEEEEDDSD